MKINALAVGIGSACLIGSGLALRSYLLGTKKVEACFGRLTTNIEITAGDACFQRETIRNRAYSCDASALSMVGIACRSAYNNIFGSKMSAKLVDITETTTTVTTTIFCKEGLETPYFKEESLVDSKIYKTDISPFFMLYMAGCSAYNQVCNTKEIEEIPLSNLEDLDEKISRVDEKLEEIWNSIFSGIGKNMVEIGQILQQD